MAYNFFEDADNGTARTVTTEVYIEILENVMNVDSYPDIKFLVSSRWCSGNVMAKKSFGENFGFSSHRPDSFGFSSLWGHVEEKNFETKLDT